MNPAIHPSPPSSSVGTYRALRLAGEQNRPVVLVGCFLATCISKLSTQRGWAEPPFDRLSMRATTGTCTCVGSYLLVLVVAAVAMGNEESRYVVEAADFHTKSVHEDGVALVLEDLLSSGAANIKEFTAMRKTGLTIGKSDHNSDRRYKSNRVEAFALSHKGESRFERKDPEFA